MHHSDFRHHLTTGITDGAFTPVSHMSMFPPHHEHGYESSMEITNDYHFNADYWSAPYKNGSTPMKEMEGRHLTISK